jgi:hypothetical protein
MLPMAREATRRRACSSNASVERCSSLHGRLLRHQSHTIAQKVDVVLEFDLAQQVNKSHPRPPVVPLFGDLDEEPRAAGCVKGLRQFPHIRGLNSIRALAL